MRQTPEEYFDQLIDEAIATYERNKAIERARERVANRDPEAGELVDVHPREDK